MRTLNKNKYIIVGILTVIIFSLGLLLGIVVNEYKIKYMEQVAKEQEVEFSSLQFQYLYLDTLKDYDRCAVVSKTLENNLKTLSPILEELERYEQDGDLKDPIYITLKRKYILANLRYWLLAQASKQSCQNEIVTIFYFYSPECKNCPDQGFTLTHLKQIFDDRLLIYPIDSTFEKEPMISILNAKYNITQYPTLVIEKEIHPGFMSKDELLKEICSLYNTPQPECSEVRDTESP
ncbi:MAG: hypothetical protein ABIG84_08205 [archaeon]